MSPSKGCYRLESTYNHNQAQYEHDKHLNNPENGDSEVTLASLDLQQEVDYVSKGIKSGEEAASKQDPEDRVNEAIKIDEQGEDPLPAVEQEDARKNCKGHSQAKTGVANGGNGGSVAEVLVSGRNCLGKIHPHQLALQHGLSYAYCGTYQCGKQHKDKVNEVEFGIRHHQKKNEHVDSETCYHNSLNNANYSQGLRGRAILSPLEKIYQYHY